MIRAEAILILVLLRCIKLRDRHFEILMYGIPRNGWEDVRDVKFEINFAKSLLNIY